MGLLAQVVAVALTLASLIVAVEYFIHPKRSRLFITGMLLSATAGLTAAYAFENSIIGVFAFFVPSFLLVAGALRYVTG